MDEERYDAFAKALAGGVLRRRVLRAAGGGALGGLLALLGAGRTRADDDDREEDDDRDDDDKCPEDDEDAAAHCPEGHRCCGGVCTAIRTDPANCGACGRACPAGKGCAGGRCVTPCSLEGAGGCEDRPACGREGCSCYPVVTNPTRDVGGPSLNACLQDPADVFSCPELKVCFSASECPPGFACTARICCGPDSVCLPLCRAEEGEADDD